MLNTSGTNQKKFSASPAFHVVTGCRNLPPLPRIQGCERRRRQEPSRWRASAYHVSMARVPSLAANSRKEAGDPLSK